MEKNAKQTAGNESPVAGNSTKNVPTNTQSTGLIESPFLLFLIFIKRNLLLILGFTILGVGLGWFLGKGDAGAYMTTMRVEPNFNSAAQLTAQISYYQSLIDDKDVSKLGKELGITSNMAGSLKTLQIEPYRDEIALFKEYNELTSTSGKAGESPLSFKAFQNAKKDTDFTFQVIKATGTDPIVLNKAMDKLIALEPTTGIATAKTAAVEATWFKFSTADSHTRIIDSLMISIKRNGVVSGQTYEGTLETLFKEKQYLMSSIDKIRLDWNKYQNTINVVSRYTQKGIKAQNNLIVKGSLVFFILGFLVAGTRELMKTLNEYESNHNV